MKMNCIKNYLVFTIAILIYSTAVVAVPTFDELDPSAEKAKTEITEVGIATSSLGLVKQALDTVGKNLDKETYEEAAKILRYNINVVSTQIKNYSDYIEAVNEKIIKVRKNKDLDNVPEENIDRAKELIKQIPQKVKKENVVAADASVGNLEKNEEYYKALEKLNYILLNKQEQLKEIEKSISIWQKIDLLIQ